MKDSVAEARNHAAAGRFDKAASIYEKVLRKRGQEGKLWIRYGETLRKAGRNSEAVEALTRAAENFAGQGQPLQAIGVLRMLLEIEPGNTAALERLQALDRERLQDATPGGVHGARAEILAKLKLKKVPAGELADPEPPPAEEEPAAAPDPADKTPAADDAGPAPVSGHPEPEEEPDEPEEIEILEDDPLQASLARSPAFAELDLDSVSDLLAILDLHRIPKGEAILREGDSGDAFFVLSGGSARVEKAAADGPVVLATLMPGDFFGEFAFLTGAPRSASVICEEDCEVVVFAREVLDALLARQPRLQRVLDDFYRQRLVGTALQLSPIFAPLDEAAREQILRWFEDIRVTAGTELITQGMPGEALYVILHGTVRVDVLPKGARKPTPVAELGQGDFFGEISLLTDRPATASCTATISTRLFRLEARYFRELCAHFPELDRSVRRIARERVVATHAKLDPGTDAPPAL